MQQVQLRRVEQEVKEVKEKVFDLEKLVYEIGELVKILTFENTRTAIELREFKEEMRAYQKQKDEELRAFREEWQRYWEKRDVEMKAYLKQKDEELRAFREEWQRYREKKEEEMREMNKKWGDLVNKWGTMVEDIIAPGIPSVLERRFNLRVKRLLQNAKSEIDDRSREYDVIAIAGDYVFLVYVKSTFREKHFKDFENALREFPEFFPEYGGYKMVPVISAFNFDKGTINKATKKRWLALQMGGDYLDFVNADKVKLP